VVSSEIRRLADRTAVAIWDIEKMVSEMQAAVVDSADNINHFSGEINTGADEVAKVGQMLGKIIDQVQMLSPRFENVVSGMNTQHHSSELIRNSMQQLNTIAQNTARSIHQYGASIQQLSMATQELEDGVSTFKVK
jgi:methyl-accepting chemotaxis protein WspA